MNQPPPVYTRVIEGLIALTGVIAVGTAGYMTIEGWSFLDAFYMTVTTVTTVGFREVHELDDAGRIFTAFLVLFGVGVAFYILTAMVAAIIEGDLGQVFGARRMKSQIEKLTDHNIVCGYGRVGEEIARELSERHAPAVVVDRDPQAIERARSDGLLVVEGDATKDETLVAAGIERCRALIAASDSDATNTYITLTAKALRAEVFVVSRVSTLEVESKLRQAGADRIVSPYAIGGRRLALAALQPIITDFFEMLPATASGERIVAELAVDEHSGLIGRELSDMLAGCRDVVVLAVQGAGGMSVGPPASTRLSSGDRVVVVGDEDELRSIGALSKR